MYYTFYTVKSMGFFTIKCNVKLFTLGILHKAFTRFGVWLVLQCNNYAHINLT